MAETKQIDIKLVIDNAEAAQSLSQIKQSIREVNNALLQTEEGTAEFDRLSSSAGKLKDKIGDLNDTLKLTQGSTFERFKNSLATIREGFTNLDPGKLSTGIKGVTQAFGGLRNAIIATGIGALVVGVGALIANFDKLKNVGGLLGKVFTGIGDTIDTVTTGLTKLTNQWGLTSIATEKVTQETLDYEKALRDVNVAIEEAAIEEKLLRGEITEGVAAREQAALKRDKLKDDAIANFEKEAAAQKLLNRQLAEDEQKKYDELADIRDNAQRQADQQFSTDIARIEKNEKAKVEAAEKAKADALKIAAEKAKAEEAKRLAREQDALKKFNELTTKVFLQNAEELAKENIRLADERNEIIRNFNRLSTKEKLKQEEDFYDALNRIDEQIAANSKKSEENKLNTRKENLDKQTQANEEYYDKLIDESLAAGEQLAKAEAGETQRQLDEYLKRLENFRRYGELLTSFSTELFDNIQSVRETDIDVELQNLETQYQNRKAFIERNVQDETERAIQLNNLDNAINKSRFALERKKIELEKQGIKRERAITIASIGLNTALGIAAAIKTGQAAKDPITFVASIVTSVAAVIATALKARNELKKADASLNAVGAGSAGGALPDFSNISSSISGGATGEAPQVPNAFNLFGTGGNANNLGQQPQAIQAFVVESDVTGVQRRVQRFREAGEI